MDEFKAGNKIRFKLEYRKRKQQPYPWGFALSNNEIFTIISNNFETLSLKKEDGSVVCHDDGTPYRFIYSWFELYKKELKTEVDYLDAFKENFKDG